MANTENIEAKLCAYVDGELDDAGRAEIEAHLAANPQHRSLMAELMKQRELLRELPRERAPEDLFESMTNQLERSVLLDGDAAPGAAPHVAGKIHRWPQVFAVAAVLLLAVGLAAVIYAVLPNQSNRTRYAVNPPSGESGSPVAVTGQAVTQPGGESALVRRGAGDRPEAKGGAGSNLMDTVGRKDLDTNDAETTMPTAVAVVPPAAPPAREIFSKSGASFDKAPADAAVMTNVFADSQLNEKLKSSPGVPDNSMLVVVSAEDPSATNQQIRAYFDNNGIAWEPLPEPMPAPLDLRDSQVVLRSRLGETRMKLKGGGEILADGQQQQPPQQQGKRAEQVQTEAFSDAAKAENEKTFSGQSQASAAAPAATPSANAADAFSGGKNMPARANAKDSGGAGINTVGGAGGAGAAAPPLEADRKGGDTAPAGAPVVKERSVDQVAAADAMRQQRESEQQQKSAPSNELSLSQPSPPPPPAAIANQPSAGVPGQQQQQAMQQQFGASAQPQMIIARQLTKQQVSALNSSIATGNRISNYSRAGETITPTTLPTALADALTLRAGLPNQAAAGASPETPLKIAKKQEDKIAEYSRRVETPALATTAPAGGVGAGTRPASAAPATGPSGGEFPVAKLDLANGAGAAGRATSGPVPATGQVTQAATVPAGAAGDERVDVVILVQPDGAGNGQQFFQEVAPNAAAADAPATTAATTTATAPAAMTAPATTTPVAK